MLMTCMKLRNLSGGGNAEITGVDIAGEGKVWNWKVKVLLLKMCFWLYWLKIALWYSLVKRTVWIWSATFDMRQGNWLEHYCCILRRIIDNFFI